MLCMQKFRQLHEKLVIHAIIDREWQRGRTLADMAENAISGGAGVVQFRDKLSLGRDFYQGALEIKRVCARHDVPLIINDRLDIALAVKADGVHLGQEDLPLDVARGLVKENFIIGVSASTVATGLTAALGADYLGVGAVFMTGTKKDVRTGGLAVIQGLIGQVPCPIIAIGGITAENVGTVVNKGVQGVAVISAILDGDIQKNTEMIRKAIDAAHRRMN